MIRFNCGACGGSVAAPEKYAGRPVRCPYCGQINLAPGIPHRTSHFVVLLRFWFVPLVIIGSWWLIWSELAYYMFGALVGITFVLWTVCHLVEFCLGPSEYFREKRKGCDPFFDMLPWPINPDPDFIKQGWGR